MKKSTKTILIVSVCFMGAGILLAGAGIASGGWPGFRLTREAIRSASSDSEPYVLEKTKLDSFSNINIELESEADIKILPSEDASCYLEYTLDGNYDKPVWTVANDTLQICQQDSGINGIHFFSPRASFELSTPQIRLYLPTELALADVNIYDSYGDLDITDISSDTMTLHLDYGDIKISGSTSAKAEITTEYGDIEFEDSTLESLDLTNEYGDCTLKNMTVKSAALTAEAGDLYLEAKNLETLSGLNEYGDTTFVLLDDIDTYSLDLTTEYGEISLPDETSGKLVSDYSEMSCTSNVPGNKKIEFTAESGNITIQKM